MGAKERTTSRKDVIRDSTDALHELLEAGAREFGSPPHHELHLPVWSPSEQEGNWERRELVTDELDAHPIFLWHVGQRSTSQSWQRAVATLQDYVDEREIAPVAMRVKHYGDQLLWTFAQAYLEQELSFRFVLERASALATDMLHVLDAPAVAVTSMLVLEGFVAAEAFDLRPGIRIRPIAHEEIRELAQLTAGGFGLPGIAEVTWPHTDWWVAHFTVQSRRGTNADLVEVNDRRDALNLALRAFKDGGGRFRHGYTKADSPFEAFGTSWVVV